MPRDSQGNSSITRSRAVTGQTVLAEQVNVPFDDVQAQLNLVMWRDGLAPMTGNLNMNGFKINGIGEATNDSDPVTLAQFNAGISLSGVPTGSIQAFRRKVAPNGWVIENGGTIGNASSGATTRANADTEALFSLLWTEFTNAELPIQTSSGAASTRGASASADFSAGKRLKLFDSRSRFIRGSDSGLNYDASLTVGAAQDDAIKAHTHTIEPHSHSVPSRSRSIYQLNGAGRGSTNNNNDLDSVSDPMTTNAVGLTTNSTGIPLETRGRSTVALICIKL